MRLLIEGSDWVGFKVIGLSEAVFAVSITLSYCMLRELMSATLRSAAFRAAAVSRAGRPDAKVNCRSEGVLHALREQARCLSKLEASSL